MIEKCAESEKVAEVGSRVLIQILVHVIGHGDHFVESPCAGQRKLSGVVQAAVGDDVSVVVNAVHEVQGIGGNVSGYKIHRIAYGGGVNHCRRPPGVIKVKIAVVDIKQICAHAAGGHDSAGTAMCRGDIIQLLATAEAVLQLVEKISAVVDVSGSAYVFERYTELFFNGQVASPDGVIYVVSVFALGEEFLTLDVIPIQSGDDGVVKVELWKR